MTNYVLVKESLNSITVKPSRDVNLSDFYSALSLYLTKPFICHKLNDGNLVIQHQGEKEVITKYLKV